MKIYFRKDVNYLIKGNNCIIFSKPWRSCYIMMDCLRVKDTIYASTSLITADIIVRISEWLKEYYQLNDYPISANSIDSVCYKITKEFNFLLDLVLVNYIELEII